VRSPYLWTIRPSSPRVAPGVYPGPPVDRDRARPFRTAAGLDWVAPEATMPAVTDQGSPGTTSDRLTAARLPLGETARRRLRRVFLEGFRASDIAEPLHSFDAERSAETVNDFMIDHGLDVVGVRREGLVRGYVLRGDLEAGSCGDHLRSFDAGEVVSDAASLQEVIRALGPEGRCFVSVLDEVGFLVSLKDLEKPPMRMFLFGMITILEMQLGRLLDITYPEESWRGLVAPGRLEKAVQLQAERQRRGESVRLLDCLQFADKAQLAQRGAGLGTLIKPAMSGQALRRATHELEQLRNNLAHGQAIVAEGWQRILVFSTRLDMILDTLVSRTGS
jgi:hypothetical protein